MYGDTLVLIGAEIEIMPNPLVVFVIVVVAIILLTQTWYGASWLIGIVDTTYPNIHIKDIVGVSIFIAMLALAITYGIFEIVNDHTRGNGDCR